MNMGLLSWVYRRESKKKNLQRLSQISNRVSEPWALMTNACILMIQLCYSKFMIHFKLNSALPSHIHSEPFNSILNIETKTSNLFDSFQYICSWAGWFFFVESSNSHSQKITWPGVSFWIVYSQIYRRKLYPSSNLILFKTRVHSFTY